MKNTLKFMALGLFSSLMIVVPVAADKPTNPGGGGGTPPPVVLTGNDVSWPQCSKHMSLPAGQAFGIVGVNGGLANNTNACLTQELSWANASSGGTSQDKAALYVNTANPGNLGVADWPKSGTSAKYGDCANGADNQACAYVYGWNMAQLDATSRGVANPGGYKWWLDVETGNSWETNTANNSADLEGMTDYFQSIGARVGLYSTSYQWGQIAGKVSSGSLLGLDSWLPGASSLSSAQANCSLPALTGGKTTVTQYVSRQVDYDYSCI